MKWQSLYLNIRGKINRMAHLKIRYTSKLSGSTTSVEKINTEYYDALSVFNSNKTKTNRIVLFEKRNIYKNIVRRKKRSHKYKEIKTLENFKGKKLKEFWRLFSKAKTESDNTLL